LLPLLPAQPPVLPQQQLLPLLLCHRWLLPLLLLLRLVAECQGPNLQLVGVLVCLLQGYRQVPPAYHAPASRWVAL
jgi:hypothetical protein